MDQGKNSSIERKLRRILDDGRHEAMMRIEDIEKEVFERIAKEIAEEESRSGKTMNLAKGLLGMKAESIREICEEYRKSGDLCSYTRGDKRSSLVMEFLNFDRMRVRMFKTRYPKAFMKWSKDEEDRLCEMMKAGESFEAMSRAFKRNINSIKLHLDRLGCEYHGLQSIPHYTQLRRPEGFEKI